MRTLPIIIFSISVLLVSCKTNEAEENLITADSLELSQADRNEITETFMATRDAWNEGNLEEFMKGYLRSDEIAFVGAAGPTYGYDATLEKYRKGYPDLDAMGKLEFNVLKLYRIDTRTAVMIGKFYLTRTIGDLQGYYTLIWQNIDGKWLIISDHSSGQPVE